METETAGAKKKRRIKRERPGCDPPAHLKRSNPTRRELPPPTPSGMVAEVSQEVTGPSVETISQRVRRGTMGPGEPAKPPPRKEGPAAGENSGCFSEKFPLKRHRRAMCGGGRWRRNVGKKTERPPASGRGRWWGVAASIPRRGPLRVTGRTKAFAAGALKQVLPGHFAKGVEKNRASLTRGRAAPRWHESAQSTRRSDDRLRGLGASSGRARLQGPCP